ncbi:MAG: hypothetical protein V3V88_00075 [Dehalococcoidia bacterium]
MTRFSENTGNFETQEGFIAHLAKKIPNNQLGLPEGFYRPDFLPYAPNFSKDSVASPTSVLEGDVLEGDANESTKNPREPLDLQAVSPNQDYTPGGSLPMLQTRLVDHPDVKAAYVPLNYSEGFPAIDGTPFWVCLPFEPPEAYQCFDMYLKQGKHGARQIYVMQEDEAFPGNITQANLQEFFHTYYWGARAKAYDMFYIAHRRKERERRALDTENSHYLMATRLMDIADTYLTDQGDELMEMLTPSGFMDLIKTATQLQRISAGLPANGPTNAAKGATHSNSAPTEIVMRTVAQEMFGDDIQESEIENRTEENKHRLETVMRNPEMLTKMQEVIIKLNETPAKESMEVL